jgi:hypothetical protein
LFTDYQTRTDKAGVDFAVKYFNENLKKKEAKKK